MAGYKAKVKIKGPIETGQTLIMGVVGGYNAVMASQPLKLSTHLEEGQNNSIRIWLVELLSWNWSGEMLRTTSSTDPRWIYQH